MSDINILFLDIETEPTLAYVWNQTPNYVAPVQVKKAGEIICVGLKWFNGRSEFYAKWDMTTKEMLQAVRDAIQKADMVVGINHERFDMPWLTTQFLLHGIELPAPTTLLDLQKFWRKKLRFFSNKLEYVGPMLVGGSKVKHQGFELWTEVMDGKASAQRKMQRYCMQDVKLTEKLYRKLRPAIPNHPHLGMTKSRECGSCGSHHVHVSKYRRTKTMLIQQLHCQNCGAYFDGTRKRLV